MILCAIWLILVSSSDIKFFQKCPPTIVAHFVLPIRCLKHSNYQLLAKLMAHLLSTEHDLFTGKSVLYYKVHGN